MSDDNRISQDNGSCILKSLVSLCKETGISSDQLRKAVEKVQNNFTLTGGLIVEAKEGIVYRGVYWNWLITSNRIFIEENHEISSMDRIPREVIINLIRILPNFLRYVECQYLNLKEDLDKAKCDIAATDLAFGEVCVHCGRRSMNMTQVQEVVGLYSYCPECLKKASDRGDIIQVDIEQKIGSLYIPKGTYVELALVPRLEWGE